MKVHFDTPSHAVRLIKKARQTPLGCLPRYYCVRVGGLEPSCLSALDPKSSASTNFAIPAASTMCCPARARTLTFLIQSQACCQLHHRTPILHKTRTSRKGLPLTSTLSYLPACSPAYLPTCLPTCLPFDATKVIFIFVLRALSPLLALLFSLPSKVGAVPRA